jgi:NAD(P)-dependent dehydrogenase (short-subunit alcohol dehydrogenase family)
MNQLNGRVALVTGAPSGLGASVAQVFAERGAAMRHTEAMTDDEWNHDLAVNLHGPFHLCHAALPHLLAVGGNIVNVASVAGLGQAYSGGLLRAKARADRTHARPGARVHRSTTAGQCGMPGWDAHSAGERIHRARGAPTSV